MIIYGSGEYKLTSQQQIKHRCPQCGEFEISFHFFKKYVHLFWIPTFPYGTRKVAYCEKCHVSYQEAIPASLTMEMENAKSRTGFAPHLFIGSIVIVLGIAAIVYFSDGKNTSYYASGKKQAEGKLVGQKQDGSWRYWYENGNIQSEQNFIGGIEEGEWSWYNEQGIKTKSGNYHNGRYHGKWSFYTDAGILIEESMYVDNRRQGLTTQYYPSGEKGAEGNFERDREEGVWTYWFENKNKLMEGQYKNGVRTGVWKYYYEDGHLNSETEFEDSKSFVISLFDKDGNQLIKDGQGEHISYHPNGQISSRGKVKDGINDGRWTSWYDDGKIKNEINFIDGVSILQISFTPEGKVMVIGGNGYHKEFHPNGVTASEGLYRNGKAHGMFLTRSESGATVSEVNYQDGKYEGETKFFHETGDPYSAGNFKDNLQTGVWTWYHQGGGKEAEVNFVNGQKEGEETFWSESGEVVKREFYEAGTLVREEAY